MIWTLIVGSFNASEKGGWGRGGNADLSYRKIWRYVKGWSVADILGFKERWYFE